jgi:hypothetical protein
MFKFISPPIAGAFLALSCLGAAPALAVSPVTFVSGKGTDTGTCASPAKPCRSFKFALGQTSPGGEIKARDPADYGGVIITKSISLTGVDGAGILGSNAITINARPDDTINVSHLTLDGFKTAARGIGLNSGGQLIITHCAVRNYTTEGIRIAPASGTANFVIRDVVAVNNAVGIFAIGVGTGNTQGSLDKVLVHKNDFGIGAGARATVLASDSTADNSSNRGFFIGTGGILRLAHSAATGNGIGVALAAGALVESAGDNFINGNGTDVSGTLTKFGTR